MFTSTEFCLAVSPIQNIAHQPTNFKDWVNFFQDEQISKTTKTHSAEQYLSHLIKHLDLSSLSWLDHPEHAGSHFMEDHHKTCSIFQDYLARRQQGGQREFFPTVSHAFEFLYRVAPTKMVDGSWLYSTLDHADQAAVKDLIHIYLEELGLGHPQANHVTMYQDLLNTYELSTYAEQLDDRYYEQAAVQLVLAYAPPEYLPLVIGFNLGYEQLPLHLLITNYELAELGINPHYFNVHITIDNAHNGHAQKSLQAFVDLYRSAEDPQRYLEMVKQGYLLNDIGKSSTQIVRELDLDQQVLKLFRQKALIGQYIHNQKCQFSGKTINEWLSQPEQIHEFLHVLMKKSWIQRGQPAEQSHFWKLIDDPDGKMFGVFNATEKQMIRDWIQGPELARRLSSHQLHMPSPVVDRQQQRKLEELRLHLRQCENHEEKLELLIPYIAPHCHYIQPGLWATQQVSKILFPFQTQALQFS
ncbi:MULTISPECIES: iron-containing redox enzyme family protein [Acinetobacter]|uniref:iron-containing redox enzyme family protein n=1 Tax=Acinetobacter TaxID=469 RepID=UPI000538C038|nr:iron-containing redox enzyme family protein [Acinetobacter sp. HR7]KGT48775.1 hypothetical protein GW12_01960 [Acinetobacter sp. HR7]